MMRSRNFTSGRSPRYGAGFSLVEVMVALIIISIGLLGIAKLQAVVLSSTGTAGKRSLGAVAAASIASAMHADRAYWSLMSSNQATVVQGAAVASSSDAGLLANPNCAAGPACTTVQMAAYDLNQWAISAQTILPGYTATIFCPPPAAAGLPNSCTITLTWTENTVAANNQGIVVGAAAFQTPTYILYVQP